MALLFTSPRFAPTDSLGALMPGGSVEFYVTGTSTPKAVYAESTLVTSLGSSVQISDDGTLRPIYLDDSGSAYKVVYKDANGDVVPNGTIDPYIIGPSASQIGAAIYGLTDAESTSEVTPTSFAYEPGNVKRYGAVGDGVTDDTAAIQAALEDISSGFGTGITGLNDRSTGPGRIYFPRGVYLVTDTLYFQYVSAEFDWDAWIYVATGNFNVIRMGRGANLYYPKVLVNSTTFASAVYYITGEDRIQSTHDAPTAVFPYAYGNLTALANEGARAFYLYSKDLSSGGDSAISFVRFLGPRAHYFNIFAELEADGTDGTAYVTSNVFRDFVYSQCRYGIEINSHDGASGVVANELNGHMNAHITPDGSESVRVIYANSTENNIDIRVWDWNISELPLTDVIHLDTGADRNDIKVRGLGSSRLTDDGTNNFVWMSGTSGGGTYQSFGGIDVSTATGSFTATLTGMSATTTGTVDYVRQGNLVTLHFPNTALTGTSNTTAMTLTGLPAAITPAVIKRVFTYVTDNGAAVAGVAIVNTDNTITFGVGGGSSGFTGSGTKGMGGNASFTYGLA